jgi:hypothetical protein
MLHPAIVATRESSIHGVCLVAERAIHKGELVWELEEAVYTWSEIEALPPERRRDFDWYGFQCGVDEYALPDDLSREMNHSCDPNTWWSGGRKLIARRDIPAREEITYDYATADIEQDIEMKCTCDSGNCRGTISNRDYLDPAWQRQYGSNLPPHVLAAIERAG